MSFFRCTQCGCIENTATSNFNIRKEGESALCSLCDPSIGKWHEIFERRWPQGDWEGNDGFLYPPGFELTDTYKYRELHQGFKLLFKCW